ncbi:hypothetical protein L6164_017693 [Bauhinia variegata]|uniref:Uncharacterized protein n=1 Tax=Bauhinia variegata TaxID=167791 RepID=A0ACB9NAK6_BAUVA|nr:hypothetical protein L6164_017693 [Bauhinia variegata]
MSSTDSDTQTRKQVMIDMLQELREIFSEFIELIGAQKGSLDVDMVALVVTFVLYFSVLVAGTVLQLHIRNSLPIFTAVLLVLGSAVSVLALSMISPTIAWISFGLWLAVFALLAHCYRQEICQLVSSVLA